MMYGRNTILPKNYLWYVNGEKRKPEKGTACTKNGPPEIKRDVDVYGSQGPIRLLESLLFTTMNENEEVSEHKYFGIVNEFENLGVEVADNSSSI